MHYLIQAELTPEAFTRCGPSVETQLLDCLIARAAELGVKLDGVLVNTGPLLDAVPEVQVLAVNAGLGTDH